MIINGKMLHGNGPALALIIVLLELSAHTTMTSVALGASPSDGFSPAETMYSSLIHTVSRNKLLWQISEGSCSSAMLVNMSSGLTLWQRLPLGLQEAQVRLYHAIIRNVQRKVIDI